MSARGVACNGGGMHLPCIHPGCDVMLPSSLVVRLCANHAHTAGLCTCRACRSKAVAAKFMRDKAARNAPGATYQWRPKIHIGDALHPNVRPVTLPRPTWELPT